MAHSYGYSGVPAAEQADGPRHVIPVSPDGIVEGNEGEPAHAFPLRGSALDCYPKKGKVIRKMERVGFCKGDYVLAMDCSPTQSGQHAGSWDMSYKYVGPGEGQYSLVETEVLEDDADRCNIFLYALAGLLAALLILMIVWLCWPAASPPPTSLSPTSGPDRPDVAEQTAATTAATTPGAPAPAVVLDITTSTTTMATTITTVTTSTEVELIVNPLKFVNIIGTSFHDRPSAAWQALAGQRESASFPDFVAFAGFLTPPLNKTQAWFVFQALDADEDQSLSKGEFTSGVDSTWRDDTSTTTVLVLHTLGTTEAPNATDVVCTAKPEVVDMSLHGFSALVHRQTGSPSVYLSWKKLSGPGGPVDFTRFASYSFGLCPPLNNTQAWNVFAKMDLNYDSTISEQEYLALAS